VRVRTHRGAPTGRSCHYSYAPAFRPYLAERRVSARASVRVCRLCGRYTRHHQLTVPCAGLCSRRRLEPRSARPHQYLSFLVMIEFTTL